MRIVLSALMITAAALPCAAFAQDRVEDFLYQPSIKSGAVSMPAPEETARREGQGHVPATDAALPAAVVEPESVPAPIAKPDVLPTTLMEEAGGTADEEQAPELPKISMLEILTKSYGSSPTLKAERELLRIQYEEVAQAYARARPDINIDGGVGLTYSDDDPGSSEDHTTKDVGLTLVQPVWAGGRIQSYVAQQTSLTDAQIAAYEAISQQVFLNVVTAAMDIVRDRAIITLSEKNREVIAEQLRASEKGFEVGALTRTDVAQAKARLAEAESNVTAAKGNYESSLARYKQYAGMDGDNTDFENDGGKLNLPGDLLAAQSIAATDNPAVVYAQNLEVAANEAIDVAAGERYPYVSLVGTADNDWNVVPGIDESRDATLGLRASLNLYEGGAMNSRIRQAKISRFEKANRVKEAARLATQQVATAWNLRQAALARIVALENQVEAATIARNGVYKEREVGTRTLLDSLDAERELLNAEVGLATAKRDAVVADYSLLAASGQLTPSRLGLMSQDAERDVMTATHGWFAGTAVQPRD